jgi:hypothetical protein
LKAPMSYKTYGENSYGRGCTLVTEHLPGMHKALGSRLSNEKKKKEKKRMLFSC